MDKNKIESFIWISLVIIGIILIITSLISLIPITNALYAGETYEHTFDGNVTNCSVDNNLSVTWNNSNIYIDIAPDYDLTNFTVSCDIGGYTEETVTAHVSGGGKRKKVIANDTTSTQNLISQEVSPSDTTAQNENPSENLPTDSNETIVDLPKEDSNNGPSPILWAILLIDIFLFLFFLRKYFHDKKIKQEGEIITFPEDLNNGEDK